MGKRLDINVRFKNEDELAQIKDSIIASVQEAIDRANLSEPGVTVMVDVVDDSEV
jgi:hypothetical protein